MDKQLPPIPSRKYFINLQNKRNREKQLSTFNCYFKTKVKPQPPASIDNIK